MWGQDIHWPSIVMGWPAIYTSVALFALALAVRRWWIAAAAAVVSIPFCFYLTLFGLLGIAGPLLLIANFAAVMALRRGEPRRAALMVLPFVCVTGLLGFGVWWQERRRMQALWERHFGGP